MSLYMEASRFIAPSNRQRGTLKSRVFADKTLKANPAQIYGLVLEASKYAVILKEVIEHADLMAAEKKLTPELALLLVHDLLLSKKGIAAPQGHKLRQSVERHKTRLHAELTKYRLRNRFASLDDLKASVARLTTAQSTPTGPAGTWPNHPRWVRINRLKTSLREQLEASFGDYRRVNSLEAVLEASNRGDVSKILYVDEHVPDLIAIPSAIDLSKQAAYVQGELILQDKASCFPAHLLSPDATDYLIIDACAAPGNKTTHLASLMSQLPDGEKQRGIVSCERDKSRAQILEKMIKVAGADVMTTVKAGQDFLRVDWSSEPWCRATALLLDPSCSGSGIIGRDDEPEQIVLPNRHLSEANSSSRKRKRTGGIESKADGIVIEEDEEKPNDTPSADRLRALGAFQAKLVQHAFHFPQARKVTYSTCSIHKEENEEVVATVLQSEVAKRFGWRVLRREEQVEGLRKWDLRGQLDDSSLGGLTKEIADACIRCEKHTSHGTQGFFVAAFVRGQDTADHVDRSGFEVKEDEDEEWSGFDD